MLEKIKDFNAENENVPVKAFFTALGGLVFAGIALGIRALIGSSDYEEDDGILENIVDPDEELDE